MILPNPGCDVSELIIEDDLALAAHRFSEFVARRPSRNPEDQ